MNVISKRTLVQFYTSILVQKQL